MKPRPDVRKTGRLPPRHSLAARSGARRLGPCLRVAILGTAALAGLAIVPTHGADATLARDRQPVAMSGADRWRLRPAQTNIVLPAAAQARVRPAMPIPEERHRVRQVYPAYTEMR
ncbi:hypothetical protein MKK70_08485 [Methylobacterium sp. E-041]|uniref:hypothetical protein n=1 Tax=unclassified Methylobacterium TaxID=2615210 RepID=UPI0011CACBAC|nr:MULTISPECIES: hypothetical protein [unclassified Methylobacterium]MCJ2105415.1 hypothetical protein [Methylobacterium sp. E-041]TXN52108.1 hypothetical protein FV227_04905 [Methylobacterium sp. WL119]TXN70360.1 hypothetical protein FV232_02135 [Methylobacterium sp. WL30]